MKKVLGYLGTAFFAVSIGVVLYLNTKQERVEPRISPVSSIPAQAVAVGTDGEKAGGSPKNVTVGERLTALTNLAERCRNPQLVDPACGDKNFGALPDAELQNYVDQGDPVALHYLGMRHYRAAPEKALELLYESVVRGGVNSLGTRAAVLANAAPGEIESEERVRYATDAYAHLIAEIVLGYPEAMNSLAGLHADRFSDIEVGVQSCRDAFALVEQLNADRAALGMRPLNVYASLSEIASFLSSDYGFCTA